MFRSRRPESRGGRGPPQHHGGSNGRRSRDDDDDDGDDSHRLSSGTSSFGMRGGRAGGQRGGSFGQRGAGGRGHQGGNGGAGERPGRTNRFHGVSKDFEGGDQRASSSNAEDLTESTSSFFADLDETRRPRKYPRVDDTNHDVNAHVNAVYGGRKDKPVDPADTSVGSRQTQDAVLWLELGLCKSLLRAVTHLGFVTPTPVQSQAIPAVIRGGDVCVRAVTGSGKTAAFLLPLLHRLVTERPVKQSSLRVHTEFIRALVIVPSRELGQQCMKMAEQLAQFTTELRVALVCGGLAAAAQEAMLLRGPQLVIGTAGRLCDICRNPLSGRQHTESTTRSTSSVAGSRTNHEGPALDLSGVEIVVLDECDKIVASDQLPQVEDLLNNFLPPIGQRQLIACSATMTDAVDAFCVEQMSEKQNTVDVGHVALASQLRQEFIRVNVREEDVVDSDVQLQKAEDTAAQLDGSTDASKKSKVARRRPVIPSVPANDSSEGRGGNRFRSAEADAENTGLASPKYHAAVTKAKTALLVAACRHYYTGPGTIVFTKYRSTAHRLAKLFNLLGISSVELQGEQSQDERFAAIAAFAEGKVKCLFSTDVASRGLDIEAVQTVINYDLPPTLTAYIHRVGRTARIGRPGVAVSMVIERDDAEIMRKILAVSSSIRRVHAANVKRRDVTAEHVDQATKDVEDIYPRLKAALVGEEVEAKLQEAERKLARMSAKLQPLTVAERFKRQQTLQELKKVREQGAGRGKRRRGNKAADDANAVIDGEESSLSTVLTVAPKRKWCLSHAEKKQREKEAAAKYKQEPDVDVDEVKAQLADLDRQESKRLDVQQQKRAGHRAHIENEMQKKKDFAKAERKKELAKVQKGATRKIKAAKIRLAKREKRAEAKSGGASDKARHRKEALRAGKAKHGRRHTRKHKKH